MSDERADPIYWLPRIALAIFVFWNILIGIGFTQTERLGSWFRFGASFWLVAYFLFLGDNFKRRIAVALLMRGCVVTTLTPELHSRINQNQKHDE